jgi:hypothetical protein
MECFLLATRARSSLDSLARCAACLCIVPPCSGYLPLSSAPQPLDVVRSKRACGEVHVRRGQAPNPPCVRCPNPPDKDRLVWARTVLSLAQRSLRATQAHRQTDGECACACTHAHAHSPVLDGFVCIVHHTHVPYGVTHWSPSTRVARLLPRAFCSRICAVSDTNKGHSCARRGRITEASMHLVGVTS